MDYAALEAHIFSEFQQKFTEYHKGGSLPGGDVQESEWLVQADVEELQDFLRAVLREVRKNTLTEVGHHITHLQEETANSRSPQTLRITFPDGFIRYANFREGNTVSFILREEQGRHGEGDVQVTRIEPRQQHKE